MQKNANVLLEKVHKELRKHFGRSATIIKMEHCIKVKTRILIDSDLDIFHNLEGMYANATIKRSDLGLVTILDFK